MKKELLKGMLVGLLLTVAIAFAQPVAASTISAGMNKFRVRSATGTIVDWGRNYIKTNNRSVPATIFYSDEAYISMDLLQRVYGNQIMWNGDSSTITLSDHLYPPNVLALTTRMDANRNTWRYSVIQNSYDLSEYLLIEDTARGYSRIYELAGNNAYEFATDCIYIMKQENFSLGSKALTLTRIPYGSNPDNQDGDDIIITVYRDLESFEDVLIGGGKVFFVHNEHHFGETSIMATNINDPRSFTTLSQFSIGHYNISLDYLSDGYLYYTAASILISRDVFQYKVKIDGYSSPILINRW